MATVIVGAGIIGSATAHALSSSPFDTAPDSIHLVEPSPRLFASASGYAAGFLARDWFDRPVAALGRLSFDMHKDLAKREGGREKWGYSGSKGFSVVEGSGGIQEPEDRVFDWLGEGIGRVLAASKGHRAESNSPRWLNPGLSVRSISDETSTAQVDPLRLSQYLLDQARARGVKLHHPARVVSVARTPSGGLVARVSSPTGEISIPCRRLVFAAGAWTPRVFASLFPDSKLHIPVTPLAGYALVTRIPPIVGSCDAVFAQDASISKVDGSDSEDTQDFVPEIFTRLPGEVYFAGLNPAAEPLPELPTETKPDERSLQHLKTIAGRMLSSTSELSGDKEKLDIIRTSLCFRPVTPSGHPIISHVPDELLGSLSVEGVKSEDNDSLKDKAQTVDSCSVWVCSGHGPWGISLSLGTGQVLAEMLEGKDVSADVSELGL